MERGSGGSDDEREKEKTRGRRKKKGVVFMWGYLPGATPQRMPILSPEPVQEVAGDSWKEVCGGGCGFALGISETGKLKTWGATDELGQAYVTAGKHEEKPEPFPLPTEAKIVKADAGWAHCVAATEHGDVYTWGWRECVPSAQIMVDQSIAENFENDLEEKHDALFKEHDSPRSQVGQSIVRSQRSDGNEHKVGEEGIKKRKLSTTKLNLEGSMAAYEAMSALPCLVSLGSGVRIASVAAGGRHTLALSDIGHVWGWGYGGEGQLGLGSRTRVVSSPQPIACIDTSYCRDKTSETSRRGMASELMAYKVPGTHIKAIACGGRHSAVVTDAGALLTFGWGLYGQCGQGSTEDELSPVIVSSLLGIRIQGVAAGLWHTVCVSVEGQVYSFGGNQFGQLGTNTDMAETLPRILDAPPFENKHAKLVSCGARHSAVVTEEGEVFCWGWNKYGQLGLGDALDRNIPSQVDLGGFCPWNLACGWWHTLLLAEAPPETS